MRLINTLLPEPAHWCGWRGCNAQPVHFYREPDVYEEWMESTHVVMDYRPPGRPWCPAHALEIEGVCINA